MQTQAKFRPLLNRLVSRGAWIFVLFTGLFCLGTRFNLDGYELEYVLSARNILHHGSPALATGFSGLPGIHDTTGDKPVYPRQNYLQSYISLPFYAIGAFLFGEGPTIPGQGGFWDLPWGPVATVALVNPIVSAGTVLLVFLIIGEFGINRRRSAYFSVLFGLTTMIWPYAGLGMEPFQTFVLTLAVFAAIRYKNTLYNRYLVLALVSILLLPACKKYGVIFMPPVLISLLISLNGKYGFRNWKFPAIIGLTFLSGLAIVTAGWMHRLSTEPDYLKHLFSRFEGTGFPSIDVVYGLLISPGEGLFPFNPILIFGVAGWILFFQKHRHEAILFGGLAGILLVAIWRLPYLLIDEEWGPRYLHTILPLLFIAGYESILKPRKGLVKTLFICVVILSMGIQILGVLFLGFSMLDAGIQMGTEDMNTMVFTPSVSQIAIAGKCLVSTINRYINQYSLIIEHRVYRNYSGLGGESRIQLKSLRGFDQPAGALYTARWVLGEVGYNVWPEYYMMILWVILTLTFISLLFIVCTRQDRSGKETSSHLV